MSITLRRAHLWFLQNIGFKYLKAKSNFNVPYLVCLGDYFSQNPYFKPDCNSEEIITSVAWCMEKEQPVIFDIGAHCGYMSTHFSALLKKNDPRIFSFEPVAPTYSDLLHTIDKLQLQDNVFPVHAALSDSDDIVTLTYSKWLSMLAHVSSDNKKRTTQTGNKHIALATTVDKVASSLGVFPHLIKLDVEGYESFVLKGAHSVLHLADKPAICIEWNPATLEQCGSSAKELASLLSGYELYYVNDYEFGKREFLEKIDDITLIPWVCNVFALPPGTAVVEKWKANIEKIKDLYHITTYQKC